MSLYDDATMIFLGEAAASGAATDLPVLKPVEKLGKELITNGGFDYDGDWTKGNGWSISNGQAVSDGSESDASLADFKNTTADLTNKTVKISFTIRDYEQGYLKVYFHGASSTSHQFKGNGNHSLIYNVGDAQGNHNGNTGPRAFNSFKGKIDNFSIKEVEQEATDLYTFRASDLSCTRVGHDGFIKKGRENLLTNSSEFDNSDWDLANGYTLTSGQSGYDLTSNAYKLEATSDGTRNLHQNITVEGLVTFSIFAKKGTTDFMRLSLTEDDENGDDYNSRVWFDLNNATTGNSTGDAYVTSSIEKIPKGDKWNGWCRCSVTFNVPSDHTVTEVAIWVTEAMGDTQVDNGDNIYIQDAQLEKGMVATPYIKNLDDTRVVGIESNKPRYDYYDTTTPRLLSEPKRTNLVKITEGVPEGKSAATLTYNHGVSPEGRKNSLKVQKNGTSENDRIRVMNESAITLVSGKKYTISAFVKNIDCVGTTTLGCRVAGQTLFRQGFGWASGSAGADISIDDNNGGQGTRTGKFAKDYGDGWWRIGFTFEADGTAASFEIDVDRDASSATDTTSIETWGWQLETTITNSTTNADAVTSYIPNFGAAAGATRNGEIIRLQGLQDKGLIGRHEGTFFVDYDQYNHNAVHFDVRNDAGPLTSSLRMFANSKTTFQFLYKNPDGGQLAFKSFGSLTSGGRRKAAMSWNRESITVSCNGSSFTTSMPSDIAENLDRLERSNFTTTLSDTRSIMLFDKQLSESELNDLTTI